MTIREFQNSSIPEIEDHIASYNRRKKQQINMIFMLSEVITNHLLAALPGGKEMKPLMPWDYDPQGFAEEKEIYLRKKNEMKLERYKEKRRMRMNQHNAMRHGEEVE